MSLTLEGGKKYTPKPSDEVRCEEHGVVTTWGKLDWLGTLAVGSGLDSSTAHNFPLRGFNTMAATEQRQFRMHPDQLFSVIKNQAGTISKAVLELVMNSIDAGATLVDIKMDRQTVSVTDDGKGAARMISIFRNSESPSKTQGLADVQNDTLLSPDSRLISAKRGTTALLLIKCKERIPIWKPFSVVNIRPASPKGYGNSCISSPATGSSFSFSLMESLRFCRRFLRRRSKVAFLN